LKRFIAALTVALSISPLAPFPAGATSNPKPWLPPVAKTSVISRLGVETSLCALRPAMSAAAASEIEHVVDFSCKPAPAYVAESLWLPSAWSLTPLLEARLRASAEIYRGFPPFNAAIGRWLDDHQALPLPSQEPIVFAAVSVIGYTAAWAFPNVIVEPGRFHGLHGSKTVPFLHGHVGVLEDLPACRRVAIPLRDGGHVLLTKLTTAARLQPCMDAPLEPRSPANGARVTFPEVELKQGWQLASLLETLGIRSIFDGSRAPFPGLGRNVAASDIGQSVLMRLDQFGVEVKATTVTDFVLYGGGQTPHHVIFDSPFAVRILDANGNDVADAVVTDIQ